MVRNRVLAPLFALLLGACAADRDRPRPEPAPEFVSELRLGGMLPADAKLTGVTVSPSGKTFVLDELSGLYEVGPSQAKLVFGRADLARLGADPSLAFTDVAALGEQRFALTAENDGFLLDLEANSFSSYFCYLPSVTPAEPPPAPGSNQVVSVSTGYRLQG